MKFGKRQDRHGQILHIHWSQHVTNAEISARTGLPPVMDFIKRRRLSVFGHTARLTQGTPAHNALHCQVGLASGRSLGRDWRVETSSWPSSRAMDRPTPQRHWICSCQPLETDRPSYRACTGPRWSDATARAGYEMTTTTTTKPTCYGLATGKLV